VVVLLAAAGLPLTSSLIATGHLDRASHAAALRWEAEAAPPRLLDTDVLSTRGVFLKPTAPVVESAARRDPARYRVRSGDTVSEIAAAFRLTVDSVRWANQLTDIDDLKIGQELWIPPVNGVLVRTVAGDTLDALAAKYRGERQAIVEFNVLRDPDHLVPASLLMIPDGEGERYVPPAPAPAPAPVSAPPVARSSGGGNHFPWGYCTYWVASKRYVPWNGNAWQWWANARAYGYPEGPSPRPGAIMVTWESSIGHVAYVESVAPDGTFTVSEMNYRWWGQVSYRTITPSQLRRIALLGFIY